MNASIRQIAKRILTRGLTAIALSLPLTAPIASHATEPTTRLTAKQVNDIALKGAVWVFQGTTKDAKTIGSGWVVDKDQRLIVTNEHCIRGQDEVEVFFPAYEGGKVIREIDHYHKKMKPVKAVVIDRDTVRDLALLQVETLPETAHALKVADKSAEEGDEVRSVGALPRGNDALWGTARGEVRLVSKYRNANGGLITMLISDIPINPGNSGGAVVNDKGEVVAVVEGERTDSRNVTIHVDVTELKTFLTEAKACLKPKTAEEFASRGKRRSDEGRYDSARADFTKALKLDKKNVAAMIGRGIVFAAKGDHVTAIADFDEAIAIDSDNANAIRQRGRSQVKLKQLDKGIADFTRCIRIDPDNFHGYNDRGNVLYDQKKFTDAVDDYSRAISLRKDDHVLWSNRGGTHRELGNHTQALADFTEAAKLAPRNVYYQNQIGLANYRLKKYADALVGFREASNFDPTFWLYRANMADAMFELNDFEGALAQCSEAIRLSSRVPKVEIAWTMYRRGTCHQKLNNASAAKADFQAAIEIDPKLTKAKDALTAIATTDAKGTTTVKK